MTHWRLTLTILVLLGFTFVSATWAELPVDFNRDVRPILSNKCFACHGPDEAQRQAGLRLDDARVATAELESGAIAIVAGNPDASELIQRIMHPDESQRMPPAEFGKPLSLDEKSILRRWIEQGARYAAHWSYVVPVRPTPPAVPSAWKHWPQNPIDHFALQAMLAQKLSPSPEAEAFVLVRRVFLDLTGLPPTIEEAGAFAEDTDPQAYEKLVDDLLERPSFGEHWARPWLDLARYADSAGYADDPPRNIWAYRDWVIRAINQNMPFDQFTIEQVAGDLLPNPSEEQLVATAFHRNTMANNEGGTQDEEFRNAAIVDRVNTTMAVWMGTTIACAQCHDHKYDPITQQEYFRFFAILNNTEDEDRGDETPVLPIFSDEQQRKQEELRTRIGRLQAVLETTTDEVVLEQHKWEEELRADPTWEPASPKSVRRDSVNAAKVLNDGAILVEHAKGPDNYQVEIRNEGDTPRRLTAIRVEPIDSLPMQDNKDDNVNIDETTGMRVQIVPPEDPLPRGRFVRITNHGAKQILSLAEVQVFAAGQNIALAGTASQHSTFFGGNAELAIDGNSDGDFDRRSVTHTNSVDEPWWEVDLGAEHAVERIVIWNRTDNGLHVRLRDFTVEVLDSNRQFSWRKKFNEAPNPSLELSPSKVREVKLRRGLVGSQQHFMEFVLNKPATWKTGHYLRLIVEPKLLNRPDRISSFRISTTSSRALFERSRLPAALVTILDTSGDKRSTEEASDLARYFRENAAPSLRAERKELAQLTAAVHEIKPMTTLPILRERTGQRRETRLQYRGNYLDKGPVVEPGLPAVFHPATADRPLDRLSLARWLVDESNPLTARVIANRYWEALFGRGIVLTSEEFGSQGELPTHPQLLDWLATELMNSGWDTRALIRTIVTSAVYRQSSQVTGGAAETDPDNRWLARGPRVRMSAEMVRDQALSVSGLLVHAMYGPPVRPPQPSLGLTAAFGSSTDWETSSGDDRYRRGIYTTWRRSNPYPSMATFDAPNREVCTMRRSRTNTPLQCLVTLNDPVYIEAAQALARRTIQHGKNTEDRIAYAFRCCLSRPPRAGELQALIQLYQQSHMCLADRHDEAKKLATVPLGDLPDGIDAVDAAAMTVVGNVLLNLDEMILKR
jgi:hypothetical protein